MRVPYWAVAGLLAAGPALAAGVPTDVQVQLQSAMITEDGETVTADYLVREVGGEYRVLQMIVNDRKSVQSAIKKLK